MTAELKKMHLENRITVLSNKNPVVNANIIKKLKRQLNKLSV